MHRLFAVETDASLTVRGVALRGGHAGAGGGGAVQVSQGASLSLVNVNVSNCSAVAGNGGAIANEGGLVELLNSTVRSQLYITLSASLFISFT